LNSIVFISIKLNFNKGKDFATRKWLFKAIFKPNFDGNSLERLALKKIIIFEKT